MVFHINLPNHLSFFTSLSKYYNKNNKGTRFGLNVLPDFLVYYECKIKYFTKISVG